MATDSSNTAGYVNPQFLSGIDGSLEQLAASASQLLAPREFYAQVLDHVLPILHGVAGRVFSILPDGNVNALCETTESCRDEIVPWPAPSEENQWKDVFSRIHSPTLVPPFSSVRGYQNPSEYLVLLCPLSSQAPTHTFLELYSPAIEKREIPALAIEYLGAIQELAGDYHRNQRLIELERHALRANRIASFVHGVHQSLDISSTAYYVVNELQKLIDCDRLTLLLCRRSRIRVECVSGIDTPQRRSNLLRSLEDFVGTVARLDEPFWFPDGTRTLPPVVEESLSAYRDVSPVRAIAVIPLLGPAADQGLTDPKRVGALVAEWFSGSYSHAVREDLTALAGHSGLAIHNSLKHQRVPMSRVWHRIEHACTRLRLHGLPRTICVLLVALAALGMLILIPVDFAVESPGKLQPMHHKHVFAPLDGVVREVKIEHSDDVKADAELVVMEAAQLDLEYRSIEGELNTVQKKWDSVHAERLRRHFRLGETAETSFLTAEEEQLKQQIAGLKEQIEILSSQRSHLRIRSPIAGQVTSWDVERKLRGRPVARGDRLMTIASLDGPWTVELQIPSDRIGHVLRARQQMDTLAVKFVVGADPEVVYRGELQRIALSTDTVQSRDFVFAMVRVNEHQQLPPRPGAPVAAKILCGQRTIGFVWLHRLLEKLKLYLVL